MGLGNGRQESSPKDAHVLILGTYDHVSSRGKRGIAGVIQYIHGEIPWSVCVGPV